VQDRCTAERPMLLQQNGNGVRCFFPLNEEVAA
jgi:hypothetical protein